MKKTVIALSLLQLTNTYAASFSDPALEVVWGEQKETQLARIGLYAPRLIGGTLKDVFLGRTAQRVVNTGEAGINAVAGSVNGNKEQLERSGYQASDSAINLLGLGHDMVADVGASVKNVKNASSYSTSRIQLCTTNLMNNLGKDLSYEHFFNPAYHIGNLIDGHYDETSDGGASPDELRANADRGITCESVPVQSNEPESIAIERLLCTDTNFNPGYDFIGYNCGGYTRDVLKTAGLGYPSFLNMGIGSELDLKRMEKSIGSEKSRVKVICDQHVDQVREAIRLAAAGKSLTPAMMEHFVGRGYWHGQRLSADFSLQLIVLASTSKNKTLRQQVGVLTSKARHEKKFYNVYYTGNDQASGEIKINMRSTLKSILAANPGQKVDREWVESLNPEIFDLMIDISKLK